MFVAGGVPKSIESIVWQDYRGFETGMIVFYPSETVSELPIREIPEDLPPKNVPEPNYETKTFGFHGCSRSTVRTAFAKAKMHYLFFMTKYAGTNFEYLDKYLVTGYYRIAWTADVKKFHIRYLETYNCLTADSCLALRADEMHFVALEDAFVIAPDALKEWGASSRITKQTRIELDEEKTEKLLEYLRSKPNIASEYIEETERLSPENEEEEEEDEEED